MNKNIDLYVNFSFCCRKITDRCNHWKDLENYNFVLMHGVLENDSVDYQELWGFPYLFGLDQ